MRVNYFSVTFWFNIYENHISLIKSLEDTFKDEYDNFNLRNDNVNNLYIPIITALSQVKKTSLTMSKINLQYNMDMVSMDDYNKFRDKVLSIFEMLTDNNVNVLHTALCICGEKNTKESLKDITENIINPKIISDDLVDVSFKFGKKYEDLFYKIISILNKKQIKLPSELDSNGNHLPVNLIPWGDSIEDTEIIELIYEINDKYSYDYTKKYHTTEFYLNKMLYILETDLKTDVDNLIKKGEF